MTPAPPPIDWLSRAGNGFQTSKMRKSTKAVARTGNVRGNVRTDTSMPAISSITITPGYLTPRTRSTRGAAQMPTATTATSVQKRVQRSNGMSQSPTRATKLPAVPGTTGEYPAPPTLARAKARRSTSPSLLSHQLVTVHLRDLHLREVPRLELRIAQQHHAIDLRGLAGQSPLEGEGGIGA